MQDHYKKFDLTNKVAVITDASEGIGRDMAIGLAEAGADIIICSRREDKLLEVKEAAEKTGHKAAMYVIDIRNVSEIAGLKAFIKAKTDKVDILINNAAYAVTKPAWDVSKTGTQWLIQVLKACSFVARPSAQSCVGTGMSIGSSKPLLTRAQPCGASWRPRQRPRLAHDSGTTLHHRPASAPAAEDATGQG